MAVVRPNSFQTISDAEISPNRPVSEETVRKFIQNTNMLRALAPVGQIRPIQINLSGVDTPEPTVWQYANGGEITDPDSPLNGVGSQFVPNMIGFFVRGGFNGNIQVGVATVNLSHTHTIGSVGNLPGNLLRAGSDRDAFEPVHNHADPAADLSAAEPLNPAHMQCAFYFKIS